MMSNGRASLAVGCSLFCLLAFSSPSAQTIQTWGNQSPAVQAGRDAIISYGLSPEQVQELTKAAIAGATGPLTSRIADLAGKLGATQEAVQAILRAVGQQDVPLEQLPEKLAEAAAQFQKLTAQAAALNPGSPIARQLVDRAQAAIKVGQFAEAHELLSRAKQAQIAAAQQARDIARQANEAADQDLLQAASAGAADGELSMTELRYLDAAQLFKEAAELVPAGHPDEKGRFLLRQADALERQGDEHGDNAALTQAIATYRLGLIESTRQRVPLQWAMTQVGLGMALDRLGERESNKARLEEAVATFRAASEETTRDRSPLD
jgi:tetratricopeptide (TPR) repeat protein